MFSGVMRSAAGMLPESMQAAWVELGKIKITPNEGYAKILGKAIQEQLSEASNGEMSAIYTYVAPTTLTFEIGIPREHVKITLWIENGMLKISNKDLIDLNGILSVHSKYFGGEIFEKILNAKAKSIKDEGADFTSAFAGPLILKSSASAGGNSAVAGAGGRGGYRRRGRSGSRASRKNRKSRKSKRRSSKKRSSRKSSSRKSSSRRSRN